MEWDAVKGIKNGLIKVNILMELSGSLFEYDLKLKTIKLSLNF